MYQTQSTRGGLGFPIAPIIGPAIGVVSSFFGGRRPKAPRVPRGDARAFVREQYRELFCGREPDPGARGYEDCLVEGDCTAEKVRSDLMASGEYADKLARGCASFPSPPPPPGLAPAGVPNGPAGIPGDVQGWGGGSGAFDSILEYWPYIAGGVLLLMVLKK